MLNRIFRILLFCFFLSIIQTQDSIFAQKSKIDSLLTCIGTDKFDKNKIVHLISISDEYLNLNIDSSIYYAIQASDIAKKLNDKQRLADVSVKIGWSYYIKGDYPKALENYFIYLKINEELNNKGNMTHLGSIGNIYMSQGDYPKAYDYFYKALESARTLHQKQHEAIWLISIGVVKMYEFKFSEAEKYYCEALEIADSLNDKDLLTSLFSNLAIVHYEQKNYTKALQYNLKALKLAEELKNQTSIAIINGNIGSLYTKQKQYIKAYDHLYRSIDISLNIGALDNAKDVYYELSDLYENTNIPLPDTIGKRISSMEQVRLRSKYYFIKATLIKDSLFSQENKKELVRKELNYEFNKKEIAIKAENEKQQLISEAENRKQTIISWSVGGGLLLVLIATAFILRSLRTTRKQKGIIEEQKQVVEEKQKEIVDSIKYAKRIQNALLTSSEYITENFDAEHFVLFKPKDIVSGDFYWAHKTKENLFYMITADCTGHGVPGAMMSMLNISLLNEIIIERGIQLPHEVLNMQRKEIIHALNPKGSREEAKDGMDCILCTFDFNKMLLHFAAANNPLWLIRNSPEGGEFTPSGRPIGLPFGEADRATLVEYKADKMPVGKYDEKSGSFTLQTIELQKGDIIYTSTDGFADQFGTNGKKLTKKKFKEELLKIHHLPMHEQQQHLNQFFENWKGNNEQIDDVCVIGVRI